MKKGNSRLLRVGRESLEYGVYSITKAVEQRRPLLRSPRACDILLDSWRFLRLTGRIKLFAFCIMPDHCHLLLCLMGGQDLSKVLQDSFKFTARNLNLLHDRSGRFWQNGFHDHRCRTNEEVVDIAEYIEHNPVRAGLAPAAPLWCFSSAHAANRGMLDLDELFLD